MKLDNQVAIVTGSQQGIGQAIAMELAKEVYRTPIPKLPPKERFDIGIFNSSHKGKIDLVYQRRVSDIDKFFILCVSCNII